MLRAEDIVDERDGQSAAGGEEIHSDRVWRADGWTARVMKNEDDDGWAVAMTRVGDSEPALVGPWTMGRDKKNPKPLDVNAFHTLVKTATEVLQRHAQQRRSQLHKEVVATAADGARVRVELEIVPDEDDAHAWLSAWGEGEAAIAKVRVRPDFKLTVASAERWIESGYRAP